MFLVQLQLFTKVSFQRPSLHLIGGGGISDFKIFMKKTSKYKISFYSNIKKFVLEELKSKYPDVKIEFQNEEEIDFTSDILDIKAFRNLYSPTHIESNGKKLNLFRRDWKVESVPAGLNPSLAYILCMVADCKEDDILCDPFCGAGTVPITALKYFNVKRVLCSDISGGAVEKSLKNFNSADISKDRYKVFRSDISNVKFNKQNVDKIVSNLPFGIRAGDHKKNVKAYEDFEKLANRVLRKKGKVVVLTQEKVLLRKVFKKENWKVKSITRIDEGGLYPEVFEILRK